MEQRTSNLFDLHIDPQSQSYLGEAAKWAKFIAIMGFIYCGLILLLILTGRSSTVTSFGTTYEGDSSFGAAEIITSLVLLAIVFIPNLFLYRFAAKVQTALRNNDQANLTASFANLKSCYKYLGILIIVVLSLALISFFYIIIAAGMSGF